VFQTNFVEKITTQILCLITVSASRAVNAIVWKNMVQTDRPHMTV